MENSNIHNLIEQIDDELLILLQAKDVGKYQWFDFKGALKRLSDLFDELGYNDFRKRKAAQYIHVFNDLCHSVIEQTYVRHLSYDKNTHILKDEYTIIDMSNGSRSINEFESQISEDYMQRIYEHKSYPEPNNRLLTETVKVNYLLKGCDVDYSRLNDVYNADPVIEAVMGELSYPSAVLNSKDDFGGYFNIDFSAKEKYRISFEQYTQQLKAERAITCNSKNTGNFTDNLATLSGRQITNFDDLKRIVVSAPANFNTSLAQYSADMKTTINVANKIATQIDNFNNNLDDYNVKVTYIYNWFIESLDFRLDCQWYNSNSAYRQYPRFHATINNETVYFGSIIETIFFYFICLQMTDTNKVDYCKNLYYEGYTAGVNEFNQRYKDLPMANIYDWFCQWKGLHGVDIYTNRYPFIAPNAKEIEFEIKALKTMGRYSGLMYAAIDTMILHRYEHPTPTVDDQTIADAIVETTPAQQPAHFMANISYQQAQSLLSALQQNGYIDASTTADTFYYRMTGNGRPITDKIIWIKTAMSKSINLMSIIDFVTLLDVKIEPALQTIDRIFCKPNNNAIALPPDTKTRARAKHSNNQNYSKEHNALSNIIADVLQ